MMNDEYTNTLLFEDFQFPGEKSLIFCKTGLANYPYFDFLQITGPFPNQIGFYATCEFHGGKTSFDQPPGEGNFDLKIQHRSSKF
jgi:hypothetical protein